MLDRRSSPGNSTIEEAQRMFTIGKWRYDLVSRRLWCSEEVLALFGLRREASLSVRSLVRFVHPNDRALVCYCWKQLAAAHIVGGITFRIVVDGHEHFLYAPAYREYSGSEVVAVSGSIRDVTAVMENLRLDSELGAAFVGDVDTYTAPSIFLDKELRVVRMNRAAENLFGWREINVLYQELPHVPSLYNDGMRGVYERLLRKGGLIRFDTLRITKEGAPIHVGVLLEPVYDTAGEIVGIAGIYSDTFEKNYGQKLLFEVEQQLKALFQNSTDVCLILSFDKGVRYVSPSVHNVLGYSPEEYSEFTFNECVHPGDIPRYEATLQLLEKSPQKSLNVDLRFLHKDGSWRHCSTRVRHLSEYTGLTGIIMNFNDISETVRAQELMRHVAFYDSVTGLPNRKLFEERLGVMLPLQKRKQGKVAVLRIAVNRLRYIKNNLGVEQLDQLVREISTKLQEFMPKGSFVARTGEDEFSILIPGVSGSQQTIRLARQISSLFEQPFTVHNYHLHATCAIGVSLYPDDGDTAPEVIRAADIACNEAQNQGQNRIQLHTSRLNAKTFKEISLANDFQSALKNDDFVMYYQPRVDTETEQIVGAEALLRWDHDDWGLLSPTEFLHLAEETGTMVVLGKKILAKVCQQIKEWQRQGCPQISVSVNLSAQQLMDDDIVRFIQDTLALYQVDASALELEITETSILPNDPVIIYCIKTLRELGIKVYFDDFGTGYSSLNWLYQFELDGIKLDKVFIDDVPKQTVPTEIVASVIRLAHGLKLKVVAEGVETRLQTDFLRQEQCDELQGYLFSRPLPPSEFQELLTAQAQKVDAPAKSTEFPADKADYRKLADERPSRRAESQSVDSVDSRDDRADRADRQDAQLQGAESSPSVQDEEGVEGSGSSQSDHVTYDTQGSLASMSSQADHQNESARRKTHRDASKNPALRGQDRAVPSAFTTEFASMSDLWDDAAQSVREVAAAADVSSKEERAMDRDGAAEDGLTGTDMEMDVAHADASTTGQVPMTENTTSAAAGGQTERAQSPRRVEPSLDSGWGQDVDWGEGTRNPAHYRPCGLPNRRRHTRVHLPQPLIGGVTIERFKNKNVQLGYSEILISDVGAGGLRFVSKLRLPVKRDVILRFQLVVLDEEIEAVGSVVWSRELPSDLFEYGIEFDERQVDTDSLEQIFQKLEAKLMESGSESPEIDGLCSKNVYEFFMER